MVALATNGSQSTLSFGARGRVTKPVTAPSHKAKALDSTPALSDLLIQLECPLVLFRLGRLVFDCGLLPHR
jgi:hypothetical protein